MPSISKLMLIAPGLDQPGGTLTLGANATALVLAGTPRVGTDGPSFTSGAGSPEGVVTAIIGSLYLRTNGGAGTTLYVKESGAGNTGWVAK